MGVKLTLLGTFSLEVDGRLRELPTRKSMALLTYLALRHEPFHRRDMLAALLWSGVPVAQAKHSLRQALWRLRQTFADRKTPILITEGETVRLEHHAIDVDVRNFERLAASADPADLERAAELYRGELLEGFEVDEPRLDTWLGHERGRLHQLILDILARQLHTWESEPHDRVMRVASALLKLDATQEQVHRVMMKTYLKLGRPADALRQYNLCARVLQQELGIEPDAATRRLCQEILIERARGGPRRPVPAPAPPASSQASSAPTVLVLESDPVTRAVIERTLRGAGYEVILRPATGEPTLPNGTSCSAVICGLTATGSRIRLLSRLRAQGYGGFVLFVSDEVPWSHSSAAGGLRVGYARRPVRPRALLAALRQGVVPAGGGN